MNTQNNVTYSKDSSKSLVLPTSIVIAALIIALAWIYVSQNESGAPTAESPRNESPDRADTRRAFGEEVLPKEGVALPIIWGDLGAKLVSVGAVDANKLRSLYEERGTFTEQNKSLLLGNTAETFKITEGNAGYLLNLFWALGLANKNPILDTGEMMDPRYGGAANFASTGGWTLAKGDPMDHYSRHKFFSLTPDQQALVEKVSKGIYRPCCNNAVHFPDCNHGMAMLGFLELLASQGVSEQDMWNAALVINSYWFPDAYLTIAEYMREKGVAWSEVSPQEVLGINYSSASGYARVASQVRTPQEEQGGSGCSVDIPQQIAPPHTRQKSGCGV